MRERAVMLPEEVYLTFADESRELLREMEAGLLRLETEGPEPELLNAIFRGAHTIKGSAGLFSLDELVRFIHAMESVLDRLRNRALRPDARLIDELLAGRDHLERLVEHALSRDGTRDAELVADGDQLMERLARYLAPEPATAQAPPPAVALPRWHISLRCGEELLVQGMDPAAILRYLTTLGALTRVGTLTGRIPRLAELRPELCHLGFEIDLTGAVGEAELRSAFEFIADSSLIRILPPGVTPEEVGALLAELPEPWERLAPLFSAAGFPVPP